MISRIIESEINIINAYEKKWKIKTNIDKFCILPIATTNNHPVTVEGKNIEFATEGKILGLNINRRGIVNHIDITNRKANQALANLRRFHSLPINIKIHLVKAYILPIIEYPAYALLPASQNSIKKLQTTQNKAIRFASEQKHPYTKNTKQLHEENNIHPLNITLYKRSINTHTHTHKC